MKTLVVGCGRKLKKGAINLDCVRPPDELLKSMDAWELGPYLKEDLERQGATWFVQFDLNLIGKRVDYQITGMHAMMAPKGADYTKHHLPFDRDEFDRVEAEDVLEHVDDPIAVVQELGRVLKPGGILWIRGPDYRYPEIVWADLTHKRAFAERTFDGFCPDTYDGQHYGHYHGPIKFKMVGKRQENKGLEFTMEKLP